MNIRDEYPAEVRRLLNPGFLSVLIWEMACGNQQVRNQALHWTIPFIALPLVLHEDIRNSLPAKVTTSLPVWLADNSMHKYRVADRLAKLKPFVYEAMFFAATSRLILPRGTTLEPLEISAKALK